MTSQPNAQLALFVPADVPKRLEWLVENVERAGEPDLEAFDKCLVLDCLPEARRTRLPKKWLAEKAAQGCVWHVDHHHQSSTTAPTPALACVFIDQGLYHPLFFSSIWSDTRRLSFHHSEAVRYLSKLFSAGLDDREVSRQQRLLEPRRPEVLFRDIVERTEVLLSTQVDGVGNAIVVTSVEPWRHADTIQEVREWLLHYADLVVVIDKGQRRVSLWSSAGQDLKLGEAARSVLGGGGHGHMAGGPLGNMAVTTAAERLIATVARCVGGQEL